MFSWQAKRINKYNVKVVQQQFFDAIDEISYFISGMLFMTFQKLIDIYNNYFSRAKKKLNLFSNYY